MLEVYMPRPAVAIMVCTLLVLTVSAGCKPNPPVAPPAVPAEYYNCTEITPQILCDAYYTRYFIITEAEFRYNGLYFVFKNVNVTDLMFKHIDEGYVWADNLIQCFCTNASDLRHFKVGDKVDIVGKNDGTIRDKLGLMFSGCISLAPGSVQLPAPGGSGVVVPVY
jgi:hypothetical protein